jgi:serine/threonine protein kinase
MTDIKQYEPLWGSWYVDSMIGEGSFGKVYKARREEFGKTYYSVVKIISVPQNETDLRQMRSEGMDEASARSYFHAFVEDIVQEIDLLSEFRGNSNIVSFEDHKVIEKPGEVGWDILIRMELLASLTDYVHEKPFAAKDVIKLGIHICQALELCARKNTIHRDIKPDNIFVSQFEEYKLGDFGIARQIERTMSGLSKKGTYTYMAPEVFAGQEYGANVDTYSLGIVMYRFLNQNRTPFLPAFPEPITPRDRDTALQRRMKGEALPAIPGVSPAVNAIISKACAYDRRRRFASPAEMREALDKALNGGSASAASADGRAGTGASHRPDASPAGQGDAPAASRSASSADSARTPPPPPFSSERMAGMFGASAAGRASGAQTAEREQTSRTEGVFAAKAVSAKSKAGDYVRFGNYEWLVLDRRDSRLLVISKDVIARRAYDEKWTDATWETCSLRQWLNQDFYRGFGADEQARIAASHLSNPDNPRYAAKGGNDTEDKIFLLSIDEANQYFTGDQARIANYEGRAAWWWLRSPGNYNFLAAFVYFDGAVYDPGNYVLSADVGVRPALLIQI